jgi:hypothetical protein
METRITDQGGETWTPLLQSFSQSLLVDAIPLGEAVL